MKQFDREIEARMMKVGERCRCMNDRRYYFMTFLFLIRRLIRYSIRSTLSLEKPGKKKIKFANSSATGNEIVAFIETFCCEPHSSASALKMTDSIQVISTYDISLGYSFLPFPYLRPIE